jgi:hypothetical protein
MKNTKYAALLRTLKIVLKLGISNNVLYSNYFRRKTQ